MSCMLLCLLFDCCLSLWSTLWLLHSMWVILYLKFSQNATKTIREPLWKTSFLNMCAHVCVCWSSLWFVVCCTLPSTDNTSALHIIPWTIFLIISQLHITAVNKLMQHTRCSSLRSTTTSLKGQFTAKLNMHSLGLTCRAVYPSSLS